MTRGLRAAQISPSFGMKNKIINGCMRFWQRGTSFTRAAGGVYTADRWLVANNTDGTAILSKETSILPDANTGSCMKIACSVADTSIGAAQNLHFYQVIEGYNFLPLWGNACTLSFWVRSNKTGTYCVSMNNGSATFYNYISEYTINAANTWERKSITFTINPGGGTWGFVNDAGGYIGFSLCAGTNQQGTANTWQSYAPNWKSATANQVNFMDSTSNVFYLANVQLEQGGASTFEVRDIDNELRLCQRYYEKSYDIGSAPGTATTAGMFRGFTGAGGVSIYTGDTIVYKTRKRASPVLYYWDSAGNASRFSGWDSSNIIVANLNPGVVGLSGSQETEHSLGIVWSGNWYISSGIQWASDAEL